MKKTTMRTTKGGITEEQIAEIFFLHCNYFKKSPWKKEYLNSYFNGTKKGALWVVAEEDGRCIGFIIGKPRRDEKKVFNIDSLLVSPEYQNKKVGSELMKRLLKAIKRSNNFQKVTVHFRKSNKIEGFYKKFGFLNPKKVESYPDGEDRIEMETHVV